MLSSLNSKLNFKKLIYRYQILEIFEKLKKCQLQDAELPQFTIKGFETNERKIKLATGTYQVTSDSDDHQ